MEIRVAFKNDRPIAAILTLRHKNILLFKYGASDVEFHNLGGVHLLFWESICRAKRDGMRIFDFGRSAWSNKGLITFKDRWGAERIPLNYIRLPSSGRGVVSDPSAGSDWKERAAKMICSHLPGSALRITGELLYPHIG
jgi:CelD/BcsL family acetyltransferase involved in cellulose biosynthesis